LRKLTILVADDDEAVRAGLATAFTTKYSVLVAADGLDAVRIYERHGERIVAVITDLQMPRLNGFSVAEWLHHIRPKLPIVLMSSKAGEIDQGLLLRNQRLYAVRKPIEMDHLKALVNNLVGARTGQREAVRARA
jgi:two-component system, cell cycle sensor histidine kinase and response regulator CckA